MDGAADRARVVEFGRVTVDRHHTDFLAGGSPVDGAS